MPDNKDKGEDSTQNLHLAASNLRRASDKNQMDYTGMSGKFKNSSEDDLNFIRQATAEATNRLKAVSGEGNDFSTFYTEIVGQQESESTGAVGSNKTIINVNKMIQTLESQQLQTLLAAESGRLQNYIDYRRIIDMIPELSQVLDTYVDNIVSPDDFTKNSLNPSYTETLDKEDSEVLAKHFKQLLKKYKVDKRIIKLVKNSLRDGDAFIAVIKLRTQLEKFLNESGRVDKDVVASIAKKSEMKNDVNKVNLQETIEVYNKVWKEFLEEPNVEVKDFYKEISGSSDVSESKHEIKSKLMKSLNSERDTIVENAMVLINENVEVFSDSSAFLGDMIYNGMSEGLLNESNMFSDVLKPPLKSGKDGLLDADSTPMSSLERVRREGKKSSINLKGISGSAMRSLDAERVVKLKDETGCYGYIYFEPLVGLNELDTTYSVSGSSQYILSQIPTNAFDKTTGSYPYQEKVTFEKRKFIYNLFVTGLSKKIDKKFLMNNREFKDTIYNLLRQDYIVKKRIRVTFFKNEEVVHFGMDDADGIYYDSIFKPVLFTARLYIALLTNALMFRLVRAPSKRVFYIETGIDNQSGEAVNSFIRDVKSKETRFNDITSGSITNMLAQISQFNDIYVPVVDGQKPIEIETITEDSPNFQDELMEYLKKSMVAGTGTPASFVNDSESVQYARSLSMENAKYLRGCVRRQGPYGDQASELFQRLFVNEYIDDLEDSKKLEGKKGREDELENVKLFEKIAIQSLRLDFPSPASLNTTNISDQISSADPIISSILQIMFGEGSESKPQYKAMKKMLAKKFIKNIDWDEIEEMFKQAEIDSAKESLKPQDDNNPGGM